jgi:hypothetical protein
VEERSRAISNSKGKGRNGGWIDLNGNGWRKRGREGERKLRKGRRVTRWSVQKREIRNRENEGSLLFPGLVFPQATGHT